MTEGVADRAGFAGRGGRPPMRAFAAAMAVLVMLATLALASCGPHGEPPWPVEAGFAARVRVGGEIYEMEVTRVDGLLAHLEYRWKGRVIAASDVYRGLFAVAGFDEGGEFRHDIDLGAIDRLFPLGAGRSATVEGTAYVSGRAGAGRLFATFAVLRQEPVRVGDRRFETVVVRVVTRLVFADGDSEQVVRVIHYAPRLGLPVRMRFESGGRTVHWQMLAIERRPRGRANRLGTVAI